MRISDWSSDVCSSDLKALYLDAAEWDAGLADRPGGAFTPFAAPEGAGVRDAGGRPGLDYAEQRAAAQSGGSQGQIYDAVGADIGHELKTGGRVVLTAFSAGALDRLANLLHEHAGIAGEPRTEEHTSEIQSLMRISYAVFCLKKKNKKQ